MHPPSGPRVFISYSHKDYRWHARFEQHIRPLVPEKLLSVWSDTMLRAGEHWHGAILEAIEAADVALLLVSADYLASTFVLEEEIPRLLERRRQEGMLIVPVICRPCLWGRIDWLSSMLVRPHDGRPLSVRTIPQAEVEITKIVEEVLVLAQ
jgi:hypothetical protein